MDVASHYGVAILGSIAVITDGNVVGIRGNQSRGFCCYDQGEGGFAGTQVVREQYYLAVLTPGGMDETLGWDSIVKRLEW